MKNRVENLLKKPVCLLLAFFVASALHGNAAEWEADGGATRACEAAVADGALLLATEEGEVYRLMWKDGSLVAIRRE